MCVYVYSNSTYIVLAEIVRPLAVVVAAGAEGSLICALLCRAGATASPLNTTRRSLVFSYALWWVVCAVIDFFLHFNFPRLPTFTWDCLSLFLYAAAPANFSCAYQLAFYFILFFLSVDCWHFVAIVVGNHPVGFGFYLQWFLLLFTLCSFITWPDDAWKRAKYPLCNF